MSVTSGFYNSVSKDRMYNSEQLSDIFCGVINEGVFSSIGTAFAVNADTGTAITIGIGRAWLNKKWVDNDAVYPITLDASEVILDRYDAIVIETDRSDPVREGSIKCIKGTPSSTPAYPEMVSTADKKQMPLAYVFRKAGSTSVAQEDITNVIGTDVCPYITGILQVQSIEKNVAQWKDQWDQWYAIETTSNTTEINNWKTQSYSAFDTWFQSVKGQLSTDAAGHLQNEIDSETVKRILMVGLVDGEKVFSDDGTVITTTDSTGKTIVKTFTNGFLTCTSVLKDATGGLMGKMVKNFSTDGKTIDTTVTIV